MQEQILATLAYYDVLDFPLKKEEILSYLVNLGKPIQTGDIESELRRLENKNLIGQREGFYFLFDREYLVPLRQKRQKISFKKLAKTARYTSQLKYLPFIRAIFVSGSLALANSDELSDLDVLIIAKNKRIWLARLVASMILGHKRRKVGDGITPDKVCLNHFIISNPPLMHHRSMYTAQTYINLIPLFIRDKEIISDFFKTNIWLGEYVSNPKLSNWQDRYGEIWMKKNFFLSDWISKFLEFILSSFFGDWLDKFARKLQLKKILRNPVTYSSLGRVVFKEDEIAFHHDSPENNIIAKYKQNIGKFNINS